MQYIAVVEGGGDLGFNAIFPDLPGVVASAESFNELASVARDAIQAHIDATPFDQIPTPKFTPTPEVISERFGDKEDLFGFLPVAAVVERSRPVTITMSCALLQEIEDHVGARGRSAFLAEASREKLAREVG